jgi:hypothetical protein
MLVHTEQLSLVLRRTSSPKKRGAAARTGEFRAFASLRGSEAFRADDLPVSRVAQYHLVDCISAGWRMGFLWDRMCCEQGIDDSEQLRFLED